MSPKQLGILSFENVELLDLAGPYEVFTRAATLANPAPFKVFTVAKGGSTVMSHNGLSVNPNYSLDEHPPIDILLIPGGIGTRPLLEDDRVLEWTQAVADSAELVLSVCTGALLLAKVGLLKRLSATTYHTAFALLQELSPTTNVIRDQRFVDNGRVITSAGISAGIDMSLHVVARLLGQQLAVETAQAIEYDWPR